MDALPWTAARAPGEPIGPVVHSHLGVVGLLDTARTETGGVDKNRESERRLEDLGYLQ
jgi:hypothetical protein